MADIYDTGEQAGVADERTTLVTFLDYYRDAFVAKIVGVSEEDARRRLVPSATRLAGLVKHLARVEMSWFQHRLAQIRSKACLTYVAGSRIPRVSSVSRTARP